MWESAAFLALAGVVAWFWQASLEARERALDEGLRACRRHGLQFLDQSVECISIRPARGEDGRLVLRRIYRFEFSDDGVNRRSGHVLMLGDRDASVTLDPFLLH
jgi:hypothetical protein